MKTNSQIYGDIDDVVSALNNYLETHAYLFEGEYYGESSEIVSNYGFGYTKGSQRILHWVEGGDMEECSLTIDEIKAMIDKGLTDESLILIMEKCM